MPLLHRSPLKPKPLHCSAQNFFISLYMNEPFPDCFPLIFLCIVFHLKKTSYTCTEKSTEIKPSQARSLLIQILHCFRKHNFPKALTVILRFATSSNANEIHLKVDFHQRVVKSTSTVSGRQSEER